MMRFVLMAGGTGGHLFPAMALAQELRRRGHEVHLMTDHRVASYGADFPATAIHIVPSATPSVRDPVKFVTAGARILRGIAVATGKLRAIRPDAVIGFGGYPVFPPFLAASLLGIPGILQEQNAVMGRANRALARYAKRIALSFAKTKYAEPFAAKTELIGNPMRDAVRAVAGTPYPPLASDSPIRLLVVGGSQGARIFSDVMLPAVALLPEALRARLYISQQVRPEDMERVTAAYRQSGVRVELAPFFADLPLRMAESHLVITRSGASTVTELAVIGRPAILVPLPGAIDADQKNNALFIEEAGGGWIAEQATLSPQSLATRLEALLGDLTILPEAARRVAALGQPNAVTKLADMSERIARKGTPS